MRACAGKCTLPEWESFITQAIAILGRTLSIEKSLRTSSQGIIYFANRLCFLGMEYRYVICNNESR